VRASNTTAALLDQLQQTKLERAREVSELARPLLEALRGFYEPDDDARALRPYRAQPQGENTGQPESTTTVLGGGPQTRQTAFGTDRLAGLQPGELQSVISTLINLPTRYGDATTVIEPGEPAASGNLGGAFGVVLHLRRSPDFVTERS
jgi:hypothetical protein